MDAPSPTAGFTHLHVHTEYSRLDGLARLNDLCSAAKDDGQDAIAMTDHGTIGGAYRFAQAAKKHGLKPILGIEAYMAIGSRHEKNQLEVRDDLTGEGKTKRYEHLTILARNATGWANLVAMSNKSQDSYWYHPRIDYDLLAEHGDGLIVLTGCLAGPVAGPVATAALERRSIDAEHVRDVAGTAALRKALRADANLSDDDANAAYAAGAEAAVMPTPSQVAAANAAAELAMSTARANITRLIECVGRENVYVEIMDHGIDIERGNLSTMMGLADEFGLPLVVTNDSHYVHDCDCDAHDAWLAIESSSAGKPARLDDPNRFRFNGEGYHLRTEAEMRALFAGHRWQRACDETMRIAARIEADVMPPKRMRLPKFPLPAEFTTSRDYLRHLTYEGAREKYGTDPAGQLPAEVTERLAFEFSVIEGAGLSDYFLFVRDVINWARSDRGLPTAEFPDGEPGRKQPILVGPGRGSAAGACVSYCTKIVGVDPLQYGLLFERFLDPERAGMPDIDVDFEAQRREEVVSYLAARWGHDRVVKIGSFTVAQTRRAIKDAARLLDETILGDKLSKLVPIGGSGKPYSFAMLDDTDDLAAAEFRALAKSPAARKVLDLARSFEGVVNGEGIHACGILVADEPLESLVPLRIDRRKDAGANATAVARWDGPDVEDFGLLKMDILSIRNLDVVAHAVRNIAARTGEVIDPDNLPDPNDSTDPRVAKTWTLLKAGKTAGVFQLESAGMTKLSEQVAPDNLEDLSALIALFRPGPLGAGMDQTFARRKNGIEAVDYSVYTPVAAEQEVIASVLDDALGTIVYQEQLMSLSRVIAGFTPVETNKLRKAFSKKIKSMMEELREIFVERGTQELCDAEGNVTKIAFRRQTLDNLWTTFAASADYLFNKSHTAAYAQLAYVTAFLKANWPVEYGAAILAVTDGDEKRHAALAALAEDGIPVVAPDINLSEVTTMPDSTGAVRLGLAEIKEVGSAAKWVVAERARGGSFTSLADVVARVKVPDETGQLTHKIGLGALEGLIEAGALDTMGPRLGHAIALRALAVYPDLTIPVAEWGVLETSARQRARLGVALGEHPLTKFKDEMRSWAVPGITDEARNALGGRPIPLQLVGERAGGDAGVMTLGVLSAWTEKAYRGGRMANFTLEGSKTSMDGVLWNETLVKMRNDGSVPAVGTIVAVSGFAKKRSIVLSEPSEEGPGETMERVELTGTRLWSIDVNDPPTLALEPVRTPLRLRAAIEAGRALPPPTRKSPARATATDAAATAGAGEQAKPAGAKKPATTRSKPSPSVTPATTQQVPVPVEEPVPGVPDIIWVLNGFGISDARPLSGRSVATLLREVPELAVAARPSGLALVEDTMFRVGGEKDPVFVVFAVSELAASAHGKQRSTFTWKQVSDGWEQAQASDGAAAA